MKIPDLSSFIITEISQQPEFSQVSHHNQAENNLDLLCPQELQDCKRAESMERARVNESRSD